MLQAPGLPLRKPGVFAGQSFYRAADSFKMGAADCQAVVECADGKFLSEKAMSEVEAGTIILSSGKIPPAPLPSVARQVLRVTPLLLVETADATKWTQQESKAGLDKKGCSVRDIDWLKACILENKFAL